MRDAPRDPNSARASAGPPRGKRGTQPGNRNAPKRNFYESFLTPEQQKILREIQSSEGLAWEINLFRPRLAAALNDPAADLNDILLATRALVRLLRTDKLIAPARWSRS